MDYIERLVDMVLLEEGDADVRMDRTQIRYVIEKDVKVLEEALSAEDKAKLCLAENRRFT